MPISVSLVPDRLAHYRVPVFENLAVNDVVSVLTVYADLREDCSGIRKPSINEIKGKKFKYQKSRDVRIRGRLLYSSGSVVAALDSSQVVIIWGDAFCPSNWIAAILSKIKRKKLVFWTHGLYGNESSLKRFFRCLFYSLSDALILYGNRSKSLLIESGFPGESLYVINNALDFSVQDEVYISSALSIAKPGDKELKLVFVGRLTKVKRLDLLIKAVADLARKFSVNLDIVGDGVELDYLKQTAIELGIDDAVCFHGAVYDESILAKIIMSSDMTVSPGNVGLTAMHSLIYGTPVVTHGNGANQMPEYEAVRSGYSGELFEEGNLASLEDAIVRCKNNIISGSINRQTCRLVIKDSYSFDYQNKVFVELIKESLGLV